MTESVANTYSPSTRYGNSKSKGDMEITQLRSTGFKHILQEIPDRSGMYIIYVY